MRLGDLNNFWEIVQYCSGLLAGTEWGSIFPAQKEQLLVVSSIYDASVKVQSLNYSKCNLSLKKLWTFCNS